MAVLAVGYALAVLSALCNGSFVAFAKIDSVARVHLHPILFNFYVAIGVAISSLFVLPYTVGEQHKGIHFSPLGALGGVLFVCSSSLSFVAAQNIGLSTGQGVWSGAAIVVAFAWGSLGPPPVGAPLTSLPLSLLAILLLLLGVAGMVKCEPLGRLCFGTQQHNDDEPLNSDTPAGPKASARAVGLTAALAVGLFGGSILVPLAFISDEIGAVPSFGAGALVGGALITAAWYALEASRGAPPALELRATLWAGLLSGLVWNAGNLCQIIAQSVCKVPYGIAYPLLQAGLMVSGFLGICVFREIVERPAILVFFACAGLVLVGAVLLGLYGPS